MIAVLLIFALLAILAVARAAYNPNDIDNCRYQDFVAARKRMATYPALFKPTSNPCSKYTCGNAGTYCQCKWRLQNCLGTRYDCPVSYTCSACPRGYTCNGSGFAVKKNLPVSSYFDFLPPYLRGSSSSSESMEQN
jgi:hypothetical protein